MKTQAQSFPIGNRVRLANLSANPYPIFDDLRQREPISWISEIDVWFATRRADVIRILGNPDLFTVESPESLLEDTLGPTMLSRDGLEQMRLRRPFTAPFGPKAVREKTDSIHDYANQLIDAFIDHGETDLVQSFSDPLALYAVTSVLGIQVEDMKTFRGWFTDFSDALSNFMHDYAIRKRGHDAAKAFGDFIRQQMPNLTDSIIHHIAYGDEYDLSEEEVISALRVIIFGGLETTAAMFSNTMWALLQHPDQMAMILQNKSLLKNAIEESLRWESPVQTATRHITQNLEINGVQLRAGDTIQCMLGAANRDPDYFLEPEQFNIQRDNAADHLSFAVGKHFCLGAVLARLEGQLGLELLLSRLSNLELHPHYPTALRGYEFRAAPTLYVRWETS